MISVIIPSLHSPVIDHVIDALEQQTIRSQIGEIIIVGQDRYGRIPRSPHIQFINTPRPMIHGAARNLGATLAQGTYLLFVDADCVARPELAERLLARHQQGWPVVGGGLELEPGNYWTLCDNILVFAPFLSTMPAGPRRTLPSYNLSMQRDAFAAVNGFDERYTLVGEDTDLCLRLRQHGYTLFCEPRAAVYHRHVRTSARAVWQHLRQFGRIHVTFWDKYPALTDPRRTRHTLRPLAGLLMASTLLLALRDSLRLYRHAALWRCWYLLPGLVWGKLAWYWGVAETLLLQQQQKADTDAVNPAGPTGGRSTGG